MTAKRLITCDRLLNLPNSRVAVKQSNGQEIQVYISNDRKFYVTPPFLCRNL